MFKLRGNKKINLTSHKLGLELDINLASMLISIYTNDIFCS